MTAFRAHPGRLEAGRSTGSWQTYATRTLPLIPITAGQHIVRFAAISSDPTGYLMNLNWLQFNKV